MTPFNNSFRPGKKSFDFYITQVSYKPERAKAVDFSKAYYFVNQSIVGRKGKPIASVRSINGLKKYKLGAQVGTTSYDYIVRRDQAQTRRRASTTRTTRQCRPSRTGRSTDSSSTSRRRSTSRRCQVPDGKVVGQFRAVGAKERFGMVLPKGSTLTSCVNRALDRLWANGTIKNLQRIWLAKATGAPVLK